MKKFLSLVVACLMLVSCFALTASAAATEFTITASAPDADGVFGVTFTSPVALKLSSMTLTYPTDKMVVVDASTKAEVAEGANFTVDILGNHDTDKSKLISAGVVNPYTMATVNENISDAGDMFTMYFKLVNGATIDANPFAFAGTDVYSKGYGGINCTGTSATITYRISKSTATGTIAWEALKAPVVEEDKFINDEGATGGTTLTFYGRIGANWIGEDYGIIIEGKDFFGAKPGDIVNVDGNVTELSFDDWDGTFEIIMTNITDKGTAGTKTYQFFVGENVTEEATVVVE